MRKRLFFAVLLVHICLLLPVAYGAVKITILHVNDFHGRILPCVEKAVDRERPVGGAAYLAARISAERSRNPRGTLLLSAGDMFQGTPISNVFRGRPVLEIMKTLRFDGMTLGNHEFDWGRGVLEGMMQEAGFAFLSCNIVDSRSRAPEGLKPYVILERKGVKIAVIGLTAPETPYTTKAGNVEGLAFLDPVRAAAACIKEAKKKDAKLVVLLTHIGFDEDKRLAAAVPNIDVIVGGHSHTVVQDPAVVGKTIIVQAGYNGLYLGVLHLKVDEKTGGILSFNPAEELQLTTAGPDDPFDEQISKIAQSYHSRIDGVFQRKMGETAVDLERPLDGESNLGNAVTDAMRASMQADIAFHNRGGIRSDIQKGDVTLEQVYLAFPFDNMVMAMDLNGKSIRNILEKSAAKPGVLQFSGLKVKFDPKSPPGRRVVGAWVGTAPLDPERVYRVATIDFLATGGDCFSDFEKGAHVVYGGPLRDVFCDYLKRNSPLAAKIEGRIEVVGK